MCFSNRLTEERLRMHLQTLLRHLAASLGHQETTPAAKADAEHSRRQIDAWLQSGIRLEEEGPRVTPALLLLLITEEITDLAISRSLAGDVAACASALLGCDRSRAFL